MTVTMLICNTVLSAERFLATATGDESPA